MTPLDTSRSDPVTDPGRPRAWRRLGNPLIRLSVVGALGVVVYLLFVEGRVLWGEVDLLRQEVAAADLSAVVGYPGLYPRPRFAKPPREWYRQEGESVLFWADWVHGKGHRWFRAGRGDLDRTKLFEPHPQFRSMAIDYPEVESDGGTIWRRMPSDVLVIGQVLAGRQCVYPLPVLRKVEVINDVVDDQPFLITMNILAPPDRACSIFDATIDGRRVTLTSSGYFHGQSPILYDRGTESLWIERDDTLTAIAGKYKGKHLTQVARPVPIAWHTWRLSNPRSRLVIGADRLQPDPVE